jgi:hypothetical protein
LKQNSLIMRKLWLVIVAAFGLTACGSDEQTARLEIRLTDAPGDYEAVYVDIQGVEINSESGESGWKQLEVNKGIYNLIEFTNGMDTLLATAILPAGKVSQIRLKLGNDNTVVIDGDTKDLTTPSGQQSGVKLNVHADLVEGITYKLWLDFDAARSVVETGSGKYNLKPVIRTFTEAQSGAIKGVVTPAESLPAVFAITGVDTVATTYADETGKFLLSGVPEGTYTVSFDPKEGFDPFQKTSVSVSTGVVTDLGVVALQ